MNLGPKGIQEALAAVSLEGSRLLPYAGTLKHR
jgi:hypothetical protein